MERVCRVLRWPIVVPMLLGVAALLTIGSCAAVEADVRRDVQAVIAASGYESLSIGSISYRTVDVAGPGEAEEDVLAAVEQLRSTREVQYSTIEVASPVADPEDNQAPTAVSEAPIDLRGIVEGGSLTLEGTVPNETMRTSIVDAAVQAFGAASVSSVALDSGDGPGSTETASDADDFITALQVVAPHLLSGEISSRDGALTITGVASTSSAVDAIEVALAQLGAVDVVVQQSALQLGGTVSSGAIEFSGVVPDDAARTAIINAANAAFGEANVSTALEPTTGPPSEQDLGYVEDVVAILQPLAEGLEEGVFDIAGGQLRITGTAASVEGLAALQAGLDALTTLVPSSTVALPPGRDAIQTIERLLEETAITFEPGSEVLTEQGSVVVDQIAEILLEAFTDDPSLELLIAGHTDDQGQADANLVLSLAQASAVRTALIERGLPGGSLTAVGFGQTQPVAPNDSPEGREQNRRIEFTVLEG